jgi:hypothetical protein
MSTITPDPDHSAVNSGGGWISGPMMSAKDARPEYSPVSLVLDICAALNRAGIPIEPGANVMYTASIAAADVLRALGVRPTNAPDRG